MQMGTWVRGRSTNGRKGGGREMGIEEGLECRVFSFSFALFVGKGEGREGEGEEGFENVMSKMLYSSMLVLLLGKMMGKKPGNLGCVCVLGGGN